MSRKIFLPRPEERNFSCLPAPVRYARCSVVLSCPFVLGFLQLFHLGSCIFISSDDADLYLKLSKQCGCPCPPWIYLSFLPSLVRASSCSVVLSCTCGLGFLHWFHLAS